MSSATEGERVGAMKSANNEVVNLFGYGVYKGRQPCPLLDNIPNPCIELDDGTIVWGCECWWGPEERIKASIGDRQVVLVKPEREKKP